METNNYILNTINEIKEVLEENDYRKNRYNRDLEWFGLNKHDYDLLKWKDEPVEVFINMED